DLTEITKKHTGFAADLAFAESRLSIAGSKDDQLLKAHVRTDKFDIAELQKRLGGSGWEISGIIRGEADLEYNLESRENLDSSFEFRVRDGKLHGVDVEAVSFSGTLNNKVISVPLAEARAPGNRILISDVSIPMPLLQDGDALSIVRGSRAKFGVDAADFATLLQFINVGEDALPDVLRPDSLTINGYLDEGAIYIDNARAMTSESSLVIDRAIIPIPETIDAVDSVPINLAASFESSNIQGLAGLFGDISATGRLTVDINIEGSAKEPKGVVNLTGEHLEYKEMQLGLLALQGEFRARQEKPGKLESLHFTIAELKQTNNSGTLVLVTPATANWQQDRLSINAAFQLDGQSEVAIKIEKNFQKEIAAEISTLNLNSDGWLGNFIDNRYFFHGADIDTVFSGLPNNPELQIDGTVNEAGGKDVPFPLTGSFSLQYSSKGVEISEFTWKSHERNQVTVTGHLPYDPLAPEPFLDGELALNGDIHFPALEDLGVLPEPWGTARGSVVLDIDITGSWDQPQGHILLKADNIVPSDLLKQYMGSSLNLACNIAAQGDSIVLKSASLESAAYSAQAKGSWQHGISARELLQNRKAEFKGEVEADATVQLKDLNFLRDRVSGLRRIEGDIQGKLHVSGPVTSPSLHGSFFLKNGEISHTFNFPMLTAVNLQGELDENSITLKGMQAEVGGSPVNLKGSINKEKDTAAVNLHIDGKNVLLFRNNDMRMRGDVQLAVSGPLERLAVKGTTGLTGGDYTGNIDFLSKVGASSAPVSKGRGFLFSFPDPPLKNAVLDIRITTIEPFRIRNNLIRGVLRPELSLKGTGELPFLIGRVYIDPSRVVLPSGRLQIQSGLLSFLAGKPDRPQLDLVAHSKVLGYDINVVTHGPLDDPVITLSSNPALPNDDLLLLLITGQPPKEDRAGDTKISAATNVMVYLGRDFLGKWLEDESGASDESIFDRFELDYGRGITKSGEQTAEGTFRLSELKTGKRKVYYLSAEKDKYDAYNYGLKLVFRFD
ncbi:translocation/assembly module TamB domain-containing protein, partial [Thermodesulfobacteriota bacterium]